MTRKIMGYKQAIQWIVENDDTEWVYDENGSISVTASLLADIFDRTTDEVTRDIKKRLEKE